ncbi:MAG: hypothetical protein KF819_20850 [Labilithrix sp.]|nr:hypothetical protein [Labilithrix sp.]
MRAAPLSIVLVVVACSTGDPASPRVRVEGASPERDFTSGARLRARYDLVGGRVEVFRVFYDAELDADCAYEDDGGPHGAPGATAYCLPVGMAPHREGVGPYTDAACAEIAAFTPRSGAAARIVVRPRDACVAAPSVALAQPPAIARVYLRDEAGACVMGDRVSVQRAGAPVPLETFVRAVERVEPRAGRIGARVLAGDDGSRLVVGGFDRDRGDAVRVGEVTGENGLRRWVPSRVAFRGGGEDLFGDPTCATPIVTKVARTATCPLQAALVLEGTCGAGRFFALGAPLSAAFAEEATCAPASLAGTFAFALGAPIAASALAPVVDVEIGAARIARRGHGVAGDGPVTWTDIVDRGTGETCVPAEAPDGGRYCLPATSEVVNLFSDASCTELAFAHPVSGCERSPQPRFIRAAFESPARLFEVTRALDLAYADEGGGCARFFASVESRYYAVREITSTGFVRAEERRD